MARGRMNPEGMTFREWVATATWGARWSFGKTKLRKAWNAGECPCDYAALFQRPRQ